MLATVSIIIPCYNKHAYVAAAIESALAQNHSCEVIVVDDGSTDASLEKIRLFDGRIKWVSGPNRGGSAARNIGLEMARGDWIQFLDADDILPPEKIAMQLAQMEGAPKGAMAFGPWSHFHDNGDIAPDDVRHYWQSYETGADLLSFMWHKGGFFPYHTWLTPRALIEKVGPWDESLTGDDDGEFFGRILVSAGELRFCEEARVLYRHPPEGSVSRNRTLKSAKSVWQSFESVSATLLAARDDTMVRKACLARVRTLAYSWRDQPEILDRAVAWERANWLFDFTPALPTKTRWVVGLLGLKWGLALRRLILS
ncbi:MULTISPECIES: glycosyltransferase family 2 protein [Falsihalocynthiibacter]|uniref:glycosyltransferase family 2 protein n=1 Tax=Falsihalocynthiibacter TaxID=2854182 RepID=UPI003002ECDD